MRVDNFTGTRFKVAIEFMKENQALNFNGVHFSHDRNKRLVQVGSEDTWTDRITEESARAGIQRGIDTYEYLVEQRSEFSKTVEGYLPRYSLIIDEGMIIVEIASLLNGEIVFGSEYPTLSQEG